MRGQGASQPHLLPRWQLQLEAHSMASGVDACLAHSQACFGMLRGRGGGGGGGVRFQGSKGERWEETSFLVFARRCLELGCTFLFCEERQG